MPIRKRDKPALALWIADRRKAMNLKPDSLAYELGRLGYEVKEATVRGWEAGAKPSDEAIRAMERLFASEAPGDEPEVATGDTAALIAALEVQTQAMTALLNEARILFQMQARLVLELAATDRERLERAGFEVRPAGTASGTSDPPRNEFPAAPSDARGVR